MTPVEDADQARQRERERADLRARLQVEEAARLDLTIELAGWREADVIAAIDQLAGHMTPDLHIRAVDSAIHIGFRAGAKRIGEQEFFPEAAKSFPNAMPAIKRLVTRFCVASEPDRFLFGVSDAGIGLLAAAVRTIGIRDITALPLVKRYGMLVDRGHEYEFARRTAHDIVAAHGWQSQTVEFAFWVIERDFYNAIDPKIIWLKWGLDAAVVRLEPEELAGALHALGYGTQAPPGCGMSGFDRLEAAVGDAGPWERRFFTKLGALRDSGS